MERYVDPVIDREVNDSWNSHAGGAFRLVIDPSRLDTRRKWALRLRVRRGPIERVGPVLDRDGRGRAARVPRAEPEPEGRWIVSQVPVHGVRLGYRPAARRLLARIAEITDEYVDLWFATAAPVVVTAPAAAPAGASSAW